MNDDKPIPLPTTPAPGEPPSRAPNTLTPEQLKAAAEKRRTRHDRAADARAALVELVGSQQATRQMDADTEARVANARGRGLRAFLAAAGPALLLAPLGPLAVIGGLLGGAAVNECLIEPHLRNATDREAREMVEQETRARAVRALLAEANEETDDDPEQPA